jgi:hypothetical protein
MLDTSICDEVEWSDRVDCSQQGSWVWRMQEKPKWYRKLSLGGKLCPTNEWDSRSKTVSFQDVAELMATRNINEVRCIGDGEGKGAKQSLCRIQRQEPWHRCTYSTKCQRECCTLGEDTDGKHLFFSITFLMFYEPDVFLWERGEIFHRILNVEMLIPICHSIFSVFIQGIWVVCSA